MRALVVCPGRGSYGRAQLGKLPAHPIVDALDRYRASLGRPTITELDRAGAFTPKLHVAGEHASLLTFACTAVDVAEIRAEIVGVTGNSMGFYTALYVSGALDLEDAARLVETLGHYQTDNVIGAQLVYPIVDEDWRRVPFEMPDAYVSIRLGGSIVLGTDDPESVKRALPPIERGGITYPLQLPLHSAFHTPLMAATAERAQTDLADLPIRSPRITLFDGAGTMHRPWADPDALWEYTLGAQVTEPFDLEAAVGTAVAELGPDAIILPGPGDNLGGAIAQILIARRWRGLRDRKDFMEAQAGEHPIVLAMARPDQRSRCA